LPWNGGESKRTRCSSREVGVVDENSNQQQTYDTTRQTTQHETDTKGRDKLQSTISNELRAKESIGIANILRDRTEIAEQSS